MAHPVLYPAMSLQHKLGSSHVSSFDPPLHEPPIIPRHTPKVSGLDQYVCIMSACQPRHWVHLALFHLNHIQSLGPNWLAHLVLCFRLLCFYIRHRPNLSTHTQVSLQKCKQYEKARYIPTPKLTNHIKIAFDMNCIINHKTQDLKE